MSAITEQIKARLGIAEVVGGYVKLEKAGANFRARCPFHHEKTPSFFVSPSRESYYCFGCNQGGDIFSFVEAMEGLDFRGALKMLAERAGVEITPINREAQSERERLLDLLEAATTFFASELSHNQEALKYLAERGLKPETIKNWRLGFAPDGWTVLVNHLSQKGFTPAEVEKAGLAIKKDGGGYYDRFRSRLMFPLADGAGRMIGFSGRVFGQPAGAPETAKYINTPQTALYDKSLALYGYDRAKTAIRRAGTVVLVEGQMDLVMSHQAGVENTVAVSGTALTEQHLNLLHRLGERLVMAFDGDAAGAAAARRGIDLALRAGFNVAVAILPAGQDPADLIKADPKAWAKVVEEAVPVIDFCLEAIARRHLPPLEMKQAVAREVFPLIAALPGAVEQAHFVGLVAEQANLPENTVRDAVALLRSKVMVSQPLTSTPTAEPKARKAIIEEHLLGLVWWQEGKDESGKKWAAPWRNKLETLGGQNWPAREAEFGAKREEIIFRAEAFGGEVAQLEALAKELAANLERENLKTELSSALGRLKQAERAGNTVAVATELALCQKLSIAINKLNA